LAQKANVKVAGAESALQIHWRGHNRDMVVGVNGDAHINAVNYDDAAEQYWPAQPYDMPDIS